MLINYKTNYTLFVTDLLKSFDMAILNDLNHFHLTGDDTPKTLNWKWQDE